MVSTEDESDLQLAANWDQRENKSKMRANKQSKTKKIPCKH